MSIINERDGYYIMGKIIGISNNRLTISVTSPFTEEIVFFCNSYYYEAIHPPKSIKYNWENLRESHPTTSEASTYYNTDQKSFYKKESGAESEWKPTDFENIYASNPNLIKNEQKVPDKYYFFLDRYLHTLHRGQLCRFIAYAIDKNNSNNGSTSGILVEEYPDRFLWIYDPDSFSSEEWTTESVDDLVQEIRPSRDCVKRLLKSYKDDDLTARKEKLDKIWKTIKSAPERLQNFLNKYDKLTIGLGSLIFGAILATIAILTYLHKNTPPD